MNRTECIEILERHQEWRKHRRPTAITAELLTDAIDYAIAELNQGWHSVHDKEPDEGQMLFVVSDHAIYLGFWNGKDWLRFVDNTVQSIWPVQYWLELPKIPEQ